VAKCFMAWTVFLVHARKESGEKRLKALAFLSSKAEILLRFAFQALRRAIAAREDEREALVAKALMRIKYGTLHLAFSTWQELVAEAVKAKRIMGAVHPEVAAMRARLGDLEESVEGMAAELEAAPPWRGDELLTFDLAPMADALLGYGKVMGTVLECIKGLTEAVSETRLAVELGGGSWSSGIGVGVGAFVTASSTGGSAGPIGGEQFDAAELVRSRLQQLESTVFTQVDGAGQMLQQSERRLVESLQRTKGLRDASGRPTKTIEVPLHPLPIRSMDNLASATLKAELASTQQELAATRKELSDVVRSKAYRYELAYMRSELHSFLFRNSEDSPYPQDFVDAALQEADELQARSASSSRPLSPPPSGDEADGAPDADRQTQAPMPPRGTEGLRQPLLSRPASAKARMMSSSASSRSAKGYRPRQPALAAARASATGTTTRPQYYTGTGTGMVVGYATDDSVQPFGTSFPRRAPNAAMTSAAATAMEVATAQPASARACGRGPAPPQRIRPRSATARASPRMRGLLGEAPSTATSAAGSGAGSGAAAATPHQPQMDSGTSAWSSRGHFAQQMIV
jgi:hypothetical protein